MGKRTSDFMALAAIVGGAGLGLGMTSLAESQADRVPQADASSAKVEVLRRSRVVEPRSIYLRSEDGEVVRHSVVAGPRRIRVRYGPEALAPQLERLRTQVEELKLQARETVDIEALIEALEGVESLEDLELVQDLTIGVRGDDEAQRRRRRKRRPGRTAEVPNPDGSEN
jgi:hypothetical protein